MSEAERDLINLMKTWLAANPWKDRPNASEWVTYLRARVVLSKVDKYYPGGIEAFVNDHMEVSAA